jgi:hypothetical protein
MLEHQSWLDSIPASFSLLLVLLSSFSVDSMFYFIQVYKLYWPYSPCFTHHSRRLLLTSCPLFFKGYINFSRDFLHGISHMHTLYFNQINYLYILFSFSIPKFHIIQQLLLHFIMTSSYVGQYNLVFSTLYHSLVFSHFILVPANSPTITIILYIDTLYISIHLYMYRHMIMFVLMYIFEFWV